jgi:hypothetical protein
MNRVSVLAVPKLRRSFMKAASRLQQAKYNAVLIPIPRTLQTFIEEYFLGAPYELFVEKLRRSKLISEPVAPWTHIIEPLLRALREMKHKQRLLEIFCYGDSTYEEKSAQTAVKISILTFNLASTGKTDLNAWRKALESELLAEAGAFESETSFAVDVIKDYPDTACVSGVKGGPIFKRLRSTGLDAQLEYIDLPYYFTPLQILRNEILLESKGRLLTEDRMEELILEHVGYVREYILKSGDLDEAYLRWIARCRSRFILEDIMQNA